MRKKSMHIFFLKCTYTQCKSIMAASVKQLSGKHWKAWAKWAEWQLILQRLQMGRWRCPQSKEVASLALVTCADRHRYCITWMLVNMLFPDSAQGWEDCFEAAHQAWKCHYQRDIEKTWVHSDRKCCIFSLRYNCCTFFCSSIDVFAIVALQLLCNFCCPIVILKLLLYNCNVAV